MKSRIRVLLSLFICMIFIFVDSAGKVYAANIGDYCGTYQSGPNECVTSCKIVNFGEPGAYCANATTGSCGSSDCYVDKPAGWSIGCFGVAMKSLDCSSYALYECESVGQGGYGVGYETKGCASNLNLPPPIPCEPGCCQVPCGDGVQGCGDGVLDCPSGYACGVTLGCGGGGPPPPSCIIGGQPSITINSGETAYRTFSVIPSNGAVVFAGFSSGNSNVALVNPSYLYSSPYSISIYGASEGTTNITATAVMSGASCTVSSSVTVLPSDPWWQVKDSDVITNGSVTSKVPSAYLFDLVGSGGFPGAVIYSGTYNLTAARTSTKKWLANSPVTLSKTFNSAYYFNSVPPDATINEIDTPNLDGSYFQSGGESYKGYYYYMYDATSTGLPLNINSAMDLGDRKVILLVKGAGVNFGGSINLNDGSGFFMVVSTGDMNVLPQVGNSSLYSFEGIFVTDSTFSTGTLGEKADTQLKIRGTVYALGGISLQRDLVRPGNATNPAEFFEYAPDLELLFPVALGYRPTHWQEVAP